MRAVVYERYGPPDVLRVREVPVPDVGDRQVLIRVHAASVNRSDWETLTGSPSYVRLSGSGFWKPKRPILGSDVAGVIEAVGKDVTDFRPGDEVLADTLYAGAGGFAEYVAVPAGAPVVAKPPELPFDVAAALPQAGALALHATRTKGGIVPGQRVLIVGGGGGGGTLAIQMAKARGAEVTAVDNTGKLDLMRAMGADHAVDHTREDYTKMGERYHRIVDFVASRSLRANRRVLQPGGAYQVVGGNTRRIIGAAALGKLLSRAGGHQLGVLVATPSKDDLAHLAGLAAAGGVAPAIDRRYDLTEVPEALARLGANQALGKLVVTVAR